MGLLLENDRHNPPSVIQGQSVMVVALFDQASRDDASERR